MTQTRIETLEPVDSAVSLSLDMDLYPRDVLYAAAYVFLDRAFVLLDRVDDRYVLHLRSKQTVDENTLRQFAGEFENELLAQALRLRVVKANQKTIENITSLAIFGASVGADADFRADEMVEISDDSLEFVDDPLGIAVPWEEKNRGE